MRMQSERLCGTGLVPVRVMVCVHLFGLKFGRKRPVAGQEAQCGLGMLQCLMRLCWNLGAVTDSLMGCLLLWVTRFLLFSLCISC